MALQTLSGKSALITGSTQGIGLAIARGLASKGVNIVLNGFGKEAEIAETVKSIQNDFHVSCFHDGADVSDSKQVDSMITSANERFGGIDILINNAGIQYVGWGRIINISSVHGLVASKGKAGYCSAKHGLVGLAKVIALETAGTGITVNCICPGFVNTPLIAAQIEARGETFEAGSARLLSEKQPSLQFVEQEDISQMVIFLCSNAASQVTGASLSIDGGWSAQ